jgi:hypothetical protein
MKASRRELPPQLLVKAAKAPSRLMLALGES